MKKMILALFMLFLFNPRTLHADVIVEPSILDYSGFWFTLVAVIILVLITGWIRRKIRR